MAVKSAYVYNQLSVRCLYQFVIFSCGLTEEINRSCLFIQPITFPVPFTLSGAMFVHFLVYIICAEFQHPGLILLLCTEKCETCILGRWMISVCIIHLFIYSTFISCRSMLDVNTAAGNALHTPNGGIVCP